MNGWVLFRLGWLLLLGWLVLFPPRTATAQLNPADPLNFFTNLSSRLLQSELGLQLDKIQIYPTNEYTPAVHRLLQVTANLWESTADAPNGLPTVFRPRFRVENDLVYLSDYVLVTNANELEGLPLLDLTASTNAASLVPPDGNALVFGVPLVIGARKGLPNFNEFSQETIFQLTRKLQLVKAAGVITQTNQFFVLSLTAPLGVEFWNSYSNDFTRPVNIFVTNYMSVRVTNDLGVDFTQTHVVGAALTTNTWPRFLPFQQGSGSFIVPLRTNITLVPTVGYLPSGGPTGFVNATNLGLYDTSQNLLAPRWGLTITNRIQAKIMDQATGQLIDHVLLGGMISHRDLTDEISVAPIGSGNSFALLWATNTLPTGELSGRNGAIMQIGISLGNEGIPPASWPSYGIIAGGNAAQAMNAFREAYFSSAAGVLAIPFSPIIQISVPMIWQVNDPLVHHLASEMFDRERSGQRVHIVPLGNPSPGTLQNIGRLNERYKPWATYVEDLFHDPHGFNLALKDPLIRTSDHWSFPTNAPLSLAMLGRFHRGTPWQTLYLKSATTDLTTWQMWTGHNDPEVAEQTHPRRDGSLLATLQAMLITNAPQQLLSINERNPTNWLGIFDGMTVLTNTRPNTLGASAQFETLTMTSNSPQAMFLADAIAIVRSNQSGQVFRSLGGLFITPELSTISPWLNYSGAYQQQRGITDAAYEKISAQLLSRVRADSVGSVSQTGALWQIQFTGFDNFPYAVESSTNLGNWTAVSTNYPTNGVFTITDSPAGGRSKQFYRSVLLP